MASIFRKSVTLQTVRALVDSEPHPLADGYDAFISYSHLDDSRYGRLIHHRLETFATPLLKKREFRIFLDDASLAMSEDLWTTIKEQLLKSSYLLVFLSPGAARSPWVEREVREYLQHRENSQIGLVLTKGKTPWTDPEDFALGAISSSVSANLIELLTPRGQEPLIVDLRSFRTAWRRWRERWTFDNRLATIASRLSGRSKDEIFGHHIRRLRQLVLAFGVLATGLVVTTSLAFTFATNALDKAAIGQSRQLAANSRIEAENNLDLALLLAEKAFAIRPTAEAYAALFSSLTMHPYLMQVVEALPGNASTLLLTSDQKRIVAFNGSSLYRLHDAVTLEPLGPTLNIPGKQTFGIDIDKTSTILVAGQAQGTIRVLALDTGKELAKLDLPQDANPYRETINGVTRTVVNLKDVRDVAIDPSGQRIAAAFDEDIVLLRIKSDPGGARQGGEHKLSLTVEDRIERAHKVSVNNLSFLPDGRLVSNGWDSQIRIWSMKGSHSAKQMEPKSDSNESKIRPSVDGRYVSAPRTGGLYVWDLATNALIRPEEFRANIKDPEEPRNGRLSSDDKLVAAPWWQAGVFVWDIDSGKLLFGPLRGHARNTLETLFLPGGSRLLTAGSDEKMQIWDLERPYPFQLWQDTSIVPQALAISADTTHIAGIGVTDEGQEARIYKFSADGKLALRSHWKTYEGSRIAFNCTGSMIAHDSGSSIFLKDLDGNLKVEIKDLSSPVTTLAFHPSKPTLATGHKNGAVRFWNVSDGTELGTGIPDQSQHSPFIPRHVSALHWLLNGRTLLIGTGDGDLRVRDMVHKKWLRPEDPNPHMPAVWSNFTALRELLFAVDERNRAIIMVSEDSFQALDLNTGQPLTQELILPPRSHIARAVAYSPESRIMAIIMGRNVHGSASSGIVMLVDAASGQLLGQPLTAAPGLLTVAVSRDGNAMITGGTSGLTVWSLDPRLWRDKAKRIAGRTFVATERDRFHLD